MNKEYKPDLYKLLPDSILEFREKNNKEKIIRFLLNYNPSKFQIGLAVIFLLIGCVILYYGNYLWKMSFIGFILILFLSTFSIEKYSVIDYKNNCIYTELIILFIFCLKLNKNQTTDILAVYNNVLHSFSDPSGVEGFETPEEILLPINVKRSVNSKTQYYHSYEVNFLLKGGKTFKVWYVPDRVGNGYRDSINLASSLSEYFNIPQFVCEEENEIKIEYNNENDYKIESVEIQPIERKGNAFFYFAIGFIIIFIIVAVTNLYLK